MGMSRAILAANFTIGARLALHRPLGSAARPALEFDRRGGHARPPTTTDSSAARHCAINIWQPSALNQMLGALPPEAMMFIKATFRGRDVLPRIHGLTRHVAVMMGVLNRTARAATVEVPWGQLEGSDGFQPERLRTPPSTDGGATEFAIPDPTQGEDGAGQRATHPVLHRFQCIPRTVHR